MACKAVWDQLFSKNVRNFGLTEDQTVKKLSEMGEILEARETKLVELSRSNLELQEKNTDLCSQIKEAMKINAKLNEATLASEEFTQR